MPSASIIRIDNKKRPPVANDHDWQVTVRRACQLHVVKKVQPYIDSGQVNYFDLMEGLLDGAPRLYHLVDGGPSNDSGSDNYSSGRTVVHNIPLLDWEKTAGRLIARLQEEQGLLVTDRNPHMFNIIIADNESALPPPPPSQGTHVRPVLDIWGRPPPKQQDKELLVECSVCRRQVGTSRFAPHLDKCLGLGSTTRAAAAATAAGPAPTMNVATTGTLLASSSSIPSGSAANATVDLLT